MLELVSSHFRIRHHSSYAPYTKENIPKSRATKAITRLIENQWQPRAGGWTMDPVTRREKIGPSSPQGIASFNGTASIRGRGLRFYTSRDRLGPNSDARWCWSVHPHLAGIGWAPSRARRPLAVHSCCIRVCSTAFRFCAVWNYGEYRQKIQATASTSREHFNAAQMY